MVENWCQKSAYIHVNKSTFYRLLSFLEKIKVPAEQICFRYQKPVCCRVVKSSSRMSWWQQTTQMSEWDWLLNVTCNDISVIYVTAHRCAGELKKFFLRPGSQRHRFFVGFFNVPAQAPTRGQPFYMVIPKNASKWKSSFYIKCVMLGVINAIVMCNKGYCGEIGKRHSFACKGEANNSWEKTYLPKHWVLQLNPIFNLLKECMGS